MFYPHFIIQQYPLKEVVAIVKDQDAVNDLVSLEKYILEVSYQLLHLNQLQSQMSALLVNLLTV